MPFFTGDFLIAVAGITVVHFLPWLLATLPAGVLADRVDRRRILTAGNWLRAIGFGLLAVTISVGWQHLALLYAAVFLAGCAETLVDNAALAIPPRLVPRDRLEKANGHQFATQSVINTFVGPPAGAALFAFAASAALLGRVTAAYRLIVLGVVPLGALGGGILGRALGIRAPFTAAAIGLLVAGLFLGTRVTTHALANAEHTG